MDRPENLTVSALHAGASAVISWDPVAGASGYSLQRGLDGGEHQAVYGGIQTTWRDSIPSAARTASYRVQAYRSGEMSWDEREALRLNWAEWDERGGLWGEELSEWTESGELAVTPNTPPVISGEDRHLGAFFEGFSIRFSVEDPDPEARLEAVARLDGESYRVFDDLAPGEECEVEITGAVLAGMEAGSEHLIEIEATDNNGESAVRRYGFTAVEDYAGDSVFYLLRDGVAIARLGQERRWTDYLAVGTHSYVVRGVDRFDNFVDSGEAVVTLSLEHPVIADLGNPEELLALTVRRGDSPGVLRSTELPGGSELYFEGRALPVMVGIDASRRSYSLSFTSVSLADYEALSALAGKTVVYRDHYGQRIFGVLTRLEQEHRRRGAGGFDAVVDFSAELREVDFTEEVAYD